MDLLTSDTELAMVQSLLRFEQQGGNFTCNDIQIESKLMFINAGRSTLSVFANFSELAVHTVPSVVEAEKTVYLDGIAIVYKQEPPTYQANTCIVTETWFDAKQWLGYFRRVYPSLQVCLFEKNKRTRIGTEDERLLLSRDPKDPGAAVIITTMSDYTMLNKYYFQRIALYRFDTVSYKAIARRCRFLYSFNQHYITDRSQRYQTFILNTFKRAKVTLLRYQLESNVTETCQFINYNFPYVETSNSDDFTCPVCYEEKDVILRTVCNHNFCNKCLQSTFRHTHRSLCPLCRSEMYDTRVVQVARKGVPQSCRLEDLLNDLLVKSEKKIIFDYKCKRRDFNQQLVDQQNSRKRDVIANPKRIPSMFCDFSGVDFAIVISSEIPTLEFTTLVTHTFRLVYVLIPNDEQDYLWSRV